GLPGFAPGELVGMKELSLEIFEADSPEDCALFLGEAPKGFAVTLAAGGTSRELHRDGAMLPRSRGCPTGYRLHAVVVPQGATTLAGAVVIVENHPFGFEGPDRRFLAVPVGD